MRTMGFAEIETSRLCLRAIAASDWPAILTYMSDPQVTAFLPDGIFDEQAARAFARRHRREVSISAKPMVLIVSCLHINSRRPICPAPGVEMASNVNESLIEATQRF